MTSLLHANCPWRGVAEVRRYTFRKGLIIESYHEAKSKTFLRRTRWPVILEDYGYRDLRNSRWNAAALYFPRDMNRQGTYNERAPGKGGNPSLLTGARARPALPCQHC